MLHGVLEQTKGMVAGVTCGAGMPYKLSEIAQQYGVTYLPIVSSGRAFPRAVEARLFQGGGMAVGGGL
jgi:nitronate monooxygenase